MSRFLDALKTYGASVEEALERFVGDEDLYESCLESFSQDPDFGALGQAIQNQEYQEAFERAHTLKGVAGNLGLDPLYRALSNLVEALRAKDYRDLAGQLAEVTASDNAFKELMKSAGEQ